MIKKITKKITKKIKEPKRMFISIPGSTDAEIAVIQDILQNIFDEHCSEPYLVLISKNKYESIKVTADVFDSMRNK